VLEDSLKMLKSYVSESIKSTNSQPPDIHDFDLQMEISKIHPVLWNFIFRMEECKAFAKSVPTLYTILLVLFLGGTVNEKSGT
jgi:hypothetical protein